ncbi:unnamed protein product [Trichogramma brassicae]|uniref:Proteasome activator Blm10 middle HEAT repeats region domain-containing protein n=1 Tax=Trichogramma brassicae TaxID=86971 RepID=A0A6H5I466_9HYME|nr:unnamed protein product [Trichogramma brassicae]
MDVVEDIADDFENYEDDTHLGYTAEVFDELVTKEEEPTRFQRANPFNKLLPYSDVLEVEADAMLADIKANLGRCVMQRDIKIGAVAWTKMLHKYIILYDLRFTKEDHIALIKLLYELMTIPNLETGLIVSFAYRLFLLLRERYQQGNKTWKPRIPDSHKLRDVDIDAFVNSLMPIVLQCIFHINRPESFGNAVQNLANLRPNVVIPRILEKIYPSIGVDIEPHKFQHAMANLMDVARPMILGSRVVNPEYAYVEGPQQVLPILFSTLSGIDLNDFIKYMYAFACLGLYATMIPIVDCSGCTAPDLTEDERLVCEQTSKFEDFVLQFMDKNICRSGSIRDRFLLIEML